MLNQCFTTFQCCLSGSTLTRGSPGFGSGSVLAVLGKWIWNPRSIKIDIVMFCDLLPTKSTIFDVKIKLLVTVSSDRIRISIGLAPGICIQIYGTLSFKAGSGSGLKPMRIHKSPIFKFLEFIDSSSSTLDV